MSQQNQVTAPIPNFNFLQNQFVPQFQMPDMSPAQPSGQKMYSEDDILLLIKFIVKEFAQIVQNWMGRSSAGSPNMGLNAGQSGNMNSMLLSALLAKETANIQSHDMLQNQLLQQVNSILMADMVDQNNSGVSSPLERTKNGSVASFPAATTIAPEYKAPQDEGFTQPVHKVDQETKDEIETIQSSEDKTHRQKAGSDEPNEISANRIEMPQAYSILEKNQILGSLIKSFSSTSN